MRQSGPNRAETLTTSSAILCLSAFLCHTPDPLWSGLAAHHPIPSGLWMSLKLTGKWLFLLSGQPFILQYVVLRKAPMRLEGWQWEPEDRSSL